MKKSKIVVSEQLQKIAEVLQELPEHLKEDVIKALKEKHRPKPNEKEGRLEC